MDRLPFLCYTALMELLFFAEPEGLRHPYTLLRDARESLRFDIHEFSKEYNTKPELALSQIQKVRSVDKVVILNIENKPIVNTKQDTKTKVVKTSAKYGEPNMVYILTRSDFMRMCYEFRLVDRMRTNKWFVDNTVKFLKGEEL